MTPAAQRIKHGLFEAHFYQRWLWQKHTHRCVCTLSRILSFLAGSMRNWRHSFIMVAAAVWPKPCGAIIRSLSWVASPGSLPVRAAADCAAVAPTQIHEGAEITLLWHTLCVKRETENHHWTLVCWKSQRSSSSLRDIFKHWKWYQKLEVVPGVLYASPAGTVF